MMLRNSRLLENFLIGTEFSLRLDRFCFKGKLDSYTTQSLARYTIQLIVFPKLMVSAQTLQCSFCEISTLLDVSNDLIKFYLSKRGRVCKI